MYHSYSFYFGYIPIGLCRKGHEIVFTDCHGTYLLDDTVTGIALKPTVSWYLCEDEEQASCSTKVETELTDYDDIRKYAQAHRPTVRKRIVMFKESDCDKYRHAQCSYQNRDLLFQSASEKMKMNDAFKALATELYKERSETEAPLLYQEVVAQSEFDYCMPADVADEDTPTIILPLKRSDIEYGVIYRLCIVDLDEVYYYKEGMPSAIFFQYDKPLTQEFIALSASIRVRPRINGTYPFDKAMRYRHYSHFYMDIHYDEVCEEVEVNPAFACVKLKIPRGIGELMPTCYLSFSHEDKPVLERYAPEDKREPIRLACHYVKRNDTTAVVRCPLSTDTIILPKGMITARLLVFDTCIAEFTFSTDKTERGEYFRNELVIPK